VGGDDAAQGEFDVGNGSAGRKFEHVFEPDARFKSDVVNFPGRLIVEMAVIEEVRAVAAGFAIEMHLANDAVLRESFEAVVNGRQGNLGKFVLHFEKYVLCRWVNAICHERLIHFSTLSGHAQAIDFLREIVRCRGILCVADHIGRAKPSPTLVNIKNDSYFYY